MQKGNLQSTSKDKILGYIKMWENRCYINGIPDEADSRLEALGKVPSYKLICKAILKNDLTILGFNKTKSPIYHVLKRIELSNRAKPNKEYEKI